MSYLLKWGHLRATELRSRLPASMTSHQALGIIGNAFKIVFNITLDKKQLKAKCQERIGNQSFKRRDYALDAKRKLGIGSAKQPKGVNEKNASCSPVGRRGDPISTLASRLQETRRIGVNQKIYLPEKKINFDAPSGSVAPWTSHLILLGQAAWGYDLWVTVGAFRNVNKD